ncbi:hypothetical protein [Tepidimonas aquatica]|uniref:hypothetical protein n=1 Tax=Tepidimonas aquatica TaxID=247482 RepID=UPI001C8F7553|nr:hypothetical protein [Tepidimonas aquatica]
MDALAQLGDLGPRVHAGAQQLAQARIALSEQLARAVDGDDALALLCFPQHQGDVGAEQIERARQRFVRLFPVQPDGVGAILALAPGKARIQRAETEARRLRQYEGAAAVEPGAQRGLRDWLSIEGDVRAVAVALDAVRLAGQLKLQRKAPTSPRFQ